MLSSRGERAAKRARRNSDGLFCTGELRAHKISHNVLPAPPATAVGATIGTAVAEQLLVLLDPAAIWRSLRRHIFESRTPT